MEERNITTGLVAWYNHEVCRRDLSQSMRCTQTCATTQPEQTLMVPIEAPPFSGLRVNYNILKGHDDYVSTHPFPGSPVVKGAQLKIEILQLMTSQEASMQMRGEYIGLPDNAKVYYVVVKGPFLMAGILSVTSSKGPHTFNLGEEAFDAKTGNRLVWGIRE